MFFNCSSLSSIPDISKWNINNVENMIALFYNCVSLSSLPDISKWKTNSVKKMNGLFVRCISLMSLPNIQKWNNNNLSELYCLFSETPLLLSLPELSNWEVYDEDNINKIPDYDLINKINSSYCHTSFEVEASGDDYNILNISECISQKIFQKIKKFYGK